jgi:hypothetical protein
VASIFPKSSRSAAVVKYLLTLDMHHALVFLEDTPPLPNALGPGSKPGLIFLPIDCRRVGESGKNDAEISAGFAKGDALDTPAVPR